MSDEAMTKAPGGQEAGVVIHGSAGEIGPVLAGGEPGGDRAHLGKKLLAKLASILQEGVVEERKEFDANGQLLRVTQTRSSGVDSATRLATALATLFPWGLEEADARIEIVISYDGPLPQAKAATVLSTTN